MRAYSHVAQGSMPDSAWKNDQAGTYGRSQLAAHIVLRSHRFTTLVSYVPGGIMLLLVLAVLAAVLLLAPLALKLLSMCTESVEFYYDHHLHRFELLIRRPFYLCARLGSQTVLWIGLGKMWHPSKKRMAAYEALKADLANARAAGLPAGEACWPQHRTFEVLNWFPTPFSDCSRTLGRVSRATIHGNSIRILQHLDRLEHPEMYAEIAAASLDA